MQHYLDLGLPAVASWLSNFCI